MRALTWAALTGACVLLLSTVAVSVALFRMSAAERLVTDAALTDLLAVATLSFVALGALIAFRRTRNPIGWVFIAAGFAWQVVAVVDAIGHLAAADPSMVPRADLAQALTAWLWVPGIGLVGTLLLQLFPDGRPTSPRWRPLAWTSGLALVASSLVVALSPGTLRSASGVEFPNPIGVEALGAVGPALYAPLVLLVVCILASAASMVHRFRRSRGIERLQLKWLATSAVVAASLYVSAGLASLLSVSSDWLGTETPLWLGVLQTVAVFSFVLVPLATGVAIFRHRLYDIDVLIRRTLVYGALSAVLVAAYVGGVALFETVLAPITSGNGIAVAVSTLAVVALFQPLRGRIQEGVDRRFYRAKFDAERTLDAFASRLRDEVDLRALESELVTVVGETLRPASVSMWLRQARR